MPSQDIHIASSAIPGAPADLSLAATLYLPPGPPTGARLPGVVVGHGAGSRRSRHAEFCEVACEAGFAVLGLDFRGHGESSGIADGPLDLDLCAAAAFLRDHPAVDPDRVCHRGSSMGGFYGLKAAPEAGFAALALLCPATEAVILRAIDEYEEPPETCAPGEGARWDIPRLRSYFHSQESLALARLITRPVLLIHARQDEVAPFNDTILLTQSLSGDTTLLALAQGTHTSAQHSRKIHDSTVAWLKQQVTSYNART